MDQQRLPLWEGLKKHTDRNSIRLHIPGHGGGRFLPPGLKEPYAKLAPYDLTELPGLDDLHNPDGIIATAQELAAEVWGADSTYFLVNGSSAGVVAMLLATCEAGDTVIVPRNAHAAVYHGLILSGAVPHYLPVATAEEGFLLNVTADAVRIAFASCPSARAVVVTSPGYHGVCADIEAIAATARQYGALVLVDEAHGAHLGFHPDLPKASGRAADLSVQSWHKSLGALTPGAVLHQYGSRTDSRRLRAALQWLQTSSPSYPLLLSLDAARRQMALSGSVLWSQALQAAAEVRAILGQMIPVLERAWFREHGFDLDTTRLTLLTGNVGINGLEAASRLASCAIDVEMACPGHLLAIFTPGIDGGDLVRIREALSGLPACLQKAQPALLPPLPKPQAVITPRQAALGPYYTMPLEKAVGQVAAAAVTAYPPGIPVLAPGELVTQEACLFIEAAIKSGISLRGLDRSGCLCVCKGDGEAVE
ncbi:MAG: aminotransferase class I/II-fold pyridoxal phosphate-dependent enzyme [Dethiobacter sp.]|jgi:arginine/lysine/ornithine decarboxylase|nr:aminotransferase class I/II-fold pyridoxal phosphate-dependent enzyme [Dethiobacter sp.]